MGEVACGGARAHGVVLDVGTPQGAASPSADRGAWRAAHQEYDCVVVLQVLQSRATARSARIGQAWGFPAQYREAARKLVVERISEAPVVHAHARLRSPLFDGEPGASLRHVLEVYGEGETDWGWRGAPKPNDTPAVRGDHVDVTEATAGYTTHAVDEATPDLPETGMAVRRQSRTRHPPGR